MEISIVWEIHLKSSEQVKKTKKKNVPYYKLSSGLALKFLIKSSFKTNDFTIHTKLQTSSKQKQGRKCQIHALQLVRTYVGVEKFH